MLRDMKRYREIQKDIGRYRRCRRYGKYIGRYREILSDIGDMTRKREI